MTVRPLCLVLLPAGRLPAGDGRIVDFDAVHERLVAPAVAAAGLEPLRGNMETTDGPIDEAMVERLMLHDFPDIQRLKTDVFRDRVPADADTRAKLAAARRQGVEAVRTVEAGGLGGGLQRLAENLFAMVMLPVAWAGLLFNACHLERGAVERLRRLAMPAHGKGN